MYRPVTMLVMKMDHRVAVTLFIFISTVHGTSTSNEITNLCSTLQSTVPYCNCTTVTGTTLIKVDCSLQSRVAVPSGIPDYANYL